MGDACRARAECEPGLACRANVCVDEREGESCEAKVDCGERLACIAGVCATPIAPRATATRRQGWMGFRFAWVHPFLGTTLAAGSVIMRGGGFDLHRTGSVFSLSSGIYVGRSELALDVSPLSYFPFPGMGPSFQLNATYGYLLPIRESKAVSFYWPLRAGAGMFAFNSLGLAFFQLRADVVGTAVRIGHVLLEAHAPQLRYALSFVSGESLHLVTVHFGGGATYVF